MLSRKYFLGILQDIRWNAVGPITVSNMVLSFSIIYELVMLAKIVFVHVIESILSYVLATRWLASTLCSISFSHLPKLRGWGPAPPVSYAGVVAKCFDQLSRWMSPAPIVFCREVLEEEFSYRDIALQGIKA